MVSSVTSTSDANAAAQAAMKKSLGMNSADFMNLFVAQLKYQDPLKPQDPSAMLDQLSQLTLVQQSYGTNTALNNLLNAQNNSSTMSSVSFIGKNIKANGNSASFDGTLPTSMQFNLAGAVNSAQVSITDASGNVVRTATTGALSAGDNSFSWDGRDGNGTLLPAAAYSFAVSGATAAGTAVAATTYTTGTVNGISIVSGAPVLTIGSASVALSDLISVKGS